MTEMINLTEKGQEIGGFIDAVRDPFVFFIFGLGIALAVRNKAEMSLFPEPWVDLGVRECSWRFSEFCRQALRKEIISAS